MKTFGVHRLGFYAAIVGGLVAASICPCRAAEEWPGPVDSTTLLGKVVAGYGIDGAWLQRFVVRLPGARFTTVN